MSNRKNSAPSLKDEVRYKKLSDLTFEGIIIHNSGIIKDVNQTIVNMFGYEYGELSGANLIEKLFVKESKQVLNTIFKKSDKKLVELRAIKKEGTIFPVEIETKYIEYNKEYVYVSAIRDITNRKKTDNI